MAKLLGEKAVFNRLDKYYKGHFTEAQQDRAGFYGDIENELTHAWKFDLDEETHILEINKSTGKISHRVR